ncbi:MAG: hypothetical protein J6P38_07525 [Acetobacter sp.]|nr:hypothetical protein [Acetobacter sp.]
MTAIPLYQHVENVQVNDVPPMKSMNEEYYKKEFLRQCELSAEANSKDPVFQRIMEKVEELDDWIA